jgi:xenotropic and polytropic retrovirus receptor 1
MILLFLVFLFVPDTKQCLSNDFIIRPIVNCLPAWFRFAQCLRRYRDSKEAFPHLVNAGKYSTTFLVVIFATLKSYYASEYFYIFLGNTVRYVVGATYE